ncbi:MAG: glycosyltransferase family 2 protein [Clostridia bacterium]|nr:glycosyltransferase family 2 protein [Clostridia bacterium]
MNIFYNLFFPFWTLLNFITTVYCLYEACLACACFFKRKPLPEATKNHRFAAVIAARNEEAVIENLIESLQMQDYPPELIDIVVVADNCDDDTALVAEKAGAIVYKRFNKVEIGKCYVLKFAFEKIFEEHDVYDAVCVFDADNVVKRDFFHEMNKALCAGYHVAQGYRDMKNPTDTWVSGGHSIFYWAENRFYNASRSFLGLSATINGTGFMVTTDLIKKQGWELNTLTEDLEFTMQCVLNGERIGYVPEAIVYDEQPITMQQSVRQRIRWTNGYMQCFIKFCPAYIRKIVKKPNWVLCDMFMFLAYFPAVVIGLMSLLFYFVMAIMRVIDPGGLSINILILLGVAVVSFWVMAVGAILLEKKKSKKLLKAVLTYPIFNFTWIVIYFSCFFKRSGEWKPIEHIRSISIKDMDTDKAKS